MNGMLSNRRTDIVLTPEGAEERCFLSSLHSRQCATCNARVESTLSPERSPTTESSVDSEEGPTAVTLVVKSLNLCGGVPSALDENDVLGSLRSSHGRAAAALGVEARARQGLCRLRSSEI